MSAYFTDAELDALMEAADLLMPADGRLPSVAQAGLREQYIDDAVVARPDTPPLLQEFARLAAEHGAAQALAHTQAGSAEVWDAVTTVLPGAYFLSPLVRERLGYHGQVADPIVPTDPPDYADLVLPVIARGPVYRPTPQ